MKKDIPFIPVEGVSIAVARTIEIDGTANWNVYLMNRNTVKIENVLISSKGYGYNEMAEVQETSTLRHHLPFLEAGEYGLVEPIDPSVFHLNNEYWVSYYIDNQIYDKKFIFVPDTIVESNLIFIPLLNLNGILHV